jgi:O-antigen ligase
MKKLLQFLVFLTILSLPFYIFRFKIGPIPSTFLEILVYLTFLVALVGGFLKNIRSRAAVFFGGLFVLAGLIGILVDSDKMRALGLWKAYFLDGYLFFLVILSLKRDALKKIVGFLFGCGTLTAVIALIAFLMGLKTNDGRLLDLDHLSPNYLAMFLSPILVIGLIKIKEKIVAKQSFWWWGAGCLIILLALYLTGSRGAIVAVGAGLLVLLYNLMSKPKYKKIGRWITLLLAVVFLAGTVWFFRPDFTDHARKATSSNIRYYIWVTSFEMIQKNPIWGVGLSNYQDYFKNLTYNRVNYPEYIAPEALTAHNFYLQLYLTIGVIGLVVFLVLIISSYFWQIKDLAASAAFIAILAYGLVDTPFFRNDLSLLFWLLLALIYLSLPDSARRWQAGEKNVAKA